MIDPEALARISGAAAAAPGLELLLVFGSRARGDEGPASDWDLGYIGSTAFDADRLLAAIVTALGVDRVDLVDLQRANGQLRFRAARDGQPLFEAAPGAFPRFWFEAVSFWCDVAPIVHAGYDAVLAELEP